jgi:hypothetical protein
MANANGWGDGASNNNIGWGKGADNAIGWGDIHADSYAGLTDIVGTAATPSYQNEYSFQFDGVDEYIQTDATYSELNGQTKATFSAWIKPTATNLLGVILHTPRNTGASDSQFQILIDNANRLRFQIQETGSYIYSNVGVFTADTWSHILVCYDGTLTSSNRGKIFIDGVDETGAVNMNNTSFTTSIGSLYISEHSQGFWNPFSGKIDEVAIWSGTDFRTQPDVDTIYNGGIPNNLNDNGLTIPTTWFRMGEEATWNGTTWTMTDVNGGYVNTSANMAEASRTTDVPT